MEARVIITTELQLKAFIADAVSAAFKYHQPTQTTLPDADPYGDFAWLANTCSGVPKSTLRIKSASGEIPGIIKFGKRVLYEKVAVLSWLRSQTRQTVDLLNNEQNAELQINKQLSKGSRRKGVPA